MSDTSTILLQCLPGLELELADARKVFSELESYQFETMHALPVDEAIHQYHWNEELFEHQLKRVARFISLALEAANLIAARADFVRQWSAFKKLTETRWLHEVDALFSEPLDFLSTTVDGVRILVSQGKSPTELADARRLRDLLDATPYLLHQREVVPTKEHDIQVVMDDYLRACFLGDYVSKPQISGFVKNFNADGGVKSLRTAVEFKFVTSEVELKQAVSGVIEDTAGYRGSRDWTTFYSVIFQTKAFGASAHLRAELGRVGGVSWTPIVVSGEGAKKERSAQAGKTGRKAKAGRKARRAK